ncbi:MAG: DUF5011 domain-containing protein [Gammaproteobacteria bacterium]|nr:DUF5011 domain-containing protein [Gammaproteobacteria bacterium]
MSNKINALLLTVISFLFLVSCAPPPNDTTPPVITLNGADTVSLNQGDAYSDAGATATDNIDFYVPVVTSGSVDTNTAGTYTLTYTATDAAGNTATATRSVILNDTTPPVITLNDAATITVTIGDTYVEPGATAVDNLDGSVLVVISGSVNTNTAGTYSLTYTATDAAGNTSSTTRAVTVTLTDSTAPVISLNGAATITLAQGGSYVEAGATAIDNIDGAVSVTITGSVNTSTAGTYIISYSATDAAGNTATRSRTVTVSDTTAPVITLNGAAAITLAQGDAYTEAGATAFDNVDGAVSVTITGSVNTSTAGTYILTYSASDAAGNTATKTRTVTVSDTTAPVITLNGAASISIAEGGSYTEAGATATDNVDGTVNVVITGSVNTSTVGTYTITYTATDSAGNTSSLTRTVTVTDATPPVITLNGAATITLAQGDTYTELGATATDNIDGAVSVTITGSVNTSTAGTYTVTYTATDAAGNTATATRTVTVTDTTAPVITLNGPASITLTQGVAYTEQGATATDNLDGTVSVVITGSVDTATVGTYTLTYTATDAAGNSASLTRTVEITATVQSYTISGTIAADIYTYNDNDINDPTAPAQYHAGNNDPYNPQLIGNPAKVGGYANHPYSGANGANYATADWDDFYRVTLSAGDSVTLHTATTATGTFQLLLSDPATPNTIEAWSQTGAAVQTVTAPASKDYIVWVWLNGGYSNYLLTVGNISGASVNQQALTTDNFVPGELLVTYKSDSSTNPAAMSLQADIGMQMKSRIGDRTSLMDFNQQRDMVMQNLNIKKVVSAGRRTFEPVFPSGVDTTDLQNKQETLQIMQALRGRSDIESVDLNYIRKLEALPDSNALYSSLWHYDTINMPQVWNGSTITGSGTIVAVIDTGNRLGHPDMAGQFVAGYDFISNPTMARDGDGIDANPEDPGDSPPNSSFHGTHVAGTIAAANNTIGIVGVAHGAKIMPLRVLGQGGGTDTDIMQAMLFAAGLANSSGTVPAVKADVINMSLGGPGYNSAFESVVSQVRAAGVVVIAAAGNENTSALSYPASYNGVVSVSSVGQDLTRASYSNFGTAIDVAAPGGDSSKGNTVLSTIASDSTGSIVDNYAGYQGTSMAAPHVAAVAALMKQANPIMSPADFDGYLSSGSITDDHGTAGRDNTYGHGLINAAKAITVAGQPIPASFVFDLSSVVFVGSNSSQTINVSNGGTEDFTAVAATAIAYTSGSNWLSIAPVTVDGFNLGSYQIDADRTGLADGEYQATVTFSAPGSSPAISNYVLNVTLRVGLDVGVDAGYHYIFVDDLISGNRIRSIEVAPVNGLYQYSFTGLPAGEYRIIGGTDMDNDALVCDIGEACGEYSAGVALIVNSDMTGLNFNTGFTAGYGISSASEGTASDSSTTVTPSAGYAK